MSAESQKYSGTPIYRDFLAWKATEDGKSAVEAVRPLGEPRVWDGALWAAFTAGRGGYDG